MPLLDVYGCPGGSVSHTLVHLFSQGLHGFELDMFSVFPDPVRLIRDQHSQKQFNQDQQMLPGHTKGASALGHADAHGGFESCVLTSTKTANSTMFVLLIPPPSNSSCNRGDNSSSQQLDITETKLRISKAI